MGRGPKYLKRLSLSTPRAWMLDKVYAPRPSTGPRRPRKLLPLVFQRNRLKGFNQLQARNTRRKNGFVLQNKTKTRSLLLGQQRLNKAKKLLANRRRLLGANSNAATSTVSGRIRFTKYGLLTTHKMDIQENMRTIQEKIRRAQSAVVRERFYQQASPVLQNSTAPSRNRPNSYNPQKPARNLYRPPPSFYSGGGGLYSDRTVERIDRNPLPLRNNSNPVSRNEDDDNWIHTPRRVVNNNYEVRGQSRYGRQVLPITAARVQHQQPQVQARREYLDPEIQTRISFIQEQGRIRRPEQSGSGHNQIAPDFRGPVTTSSLSIGDRFRKLMN